jgi:hypothetical protein
MDKEQVRHHISAGFILTLIGILVLQGAHFGSEKRTAQKMWQKAPYGHQKQHHVPYSLAILLNGTF